MCMYLCVYLPSTIVKFSRTNRFKDPEHHKSEGVSHLKKSGVKYQKEKKKDKTKINAKNGEREKEGKEEEKLTSSTVFPLQNNCGRKYFSLSI